MLVPMTQTTEESLLHRLADIKQKLAGLAAAEGSGHQLQWSGRPVDGAVLADLEAFLGTPFPGAVASFLTEIGLGVGPYGGLLTPEQIRSQVQLDRDDCAAEGIEAPDLAAAFPITARDVTDDLAPLRPYPLDGAVRICDRGCFTWAVLALTGELAGTVWDVDGDWSDLAPWRPARPAVYPAALAPADGPVLFLDWVEQWLSQQRPSSYVSRS